MTVQRLLGCTAPAGRKAYARRGLHEASQVEPTSVFNHIHYSTNSSAWVFAYRLTPVVSALEESARVQ